MPLIDTFVSVVAPIRNDADIVEPFVVETLDVLKATYANFELVLVDDASTDGTIECVRRLLARHSCVRLLRLSRRFGHEIAISAGLDSVIGDFVVVMDPNTDPPRLIPEMVELCRDGRGIVFGLRRSRQGEPLVLRLGAGLFYWLANRVLRLGIAKDATNFRVMSRQAVNAVTQVKDRLRYLATLGAYVGYATHGVRYDMIRRRPGRSRKTFGEALNLALSIIVMNSLFPLRMVGLLGLGVSAFNAAYIVYVLLVYLFSPNVVPGWTTQSLEQAVMFFFLFIAVATISEYLGRVLEQTRERPLYFVMSEMNSSVLIGDESRKNVVAESELPRAGGGGPRAPEAETTVPPSSPQERIRTGEPS